MYPCTIYYMPDLTINVYAVARDDLGQYLRVLDMKCKVVLQFFATAQT